MEAICYAFWSVFMITGRTNESSECSEVVCEPAVYMYKVGQIHSSNWLKCKKENQPQTEARIPGTLALLQSFRP